MTPADAEIIAHRGFSAVAPENTLAALAAAWDAGADAVEFDIHTAACGTPVLFHDDMLSRTTNGVGPLKRRTLAQLKRLDAGSWFGDGFAEERIPTLAEALEACADRPGPIYAEVKGFRELEDLDRMVRIATEADLLDRTVFIAMNWTLLDRMRSQEPALRIGYIVDDADEVGEALVRARGDERALVDLRASLLLEDDLLAARFHAAGIPMAVWTVDSTSEADALVAQRVGRITTNEVAALLGWKRGGPAHPSGER